MTKVVNCKKKPYDVYIGRNKDEKFHFGNPFSHLEFSRARVKVKNRSQSIQAFEDWLLGKNYRTLEPERRQWIIKQLPNLKDKRLGCFCKPKLKCHGDILKELADNYEKYFNNIQHI